MLGQDDFLDNMGLLGNDRLLAGFGHFDRPLLERLLEFLRLQSPIDTVALRLDALLKKSDPLLSLAPADRDLEPLAAGRLRLANLQLFLDHLGSFDLFGFLLSFARVNP